tara:strand:- start:184 stop:441 length:258 start_codon:yes stop_codon:yes gene_type:complete
MTLQDLLNKVCDGGSDGHGSRRIGITSGMFSAYRNKRKIPSDEVVEKMISVTGLNPVEVYMAVYAERIHNPAVVKAFRNPSQFAA